MGSKIKKKLGESPRNSKFTKIQKTLKNFTFVKNFETQRVYVLGRVYGCGT